MVTGTQKVLNYRSVQIQATTMSIAWVLPCHSGRVSVDGGRLRSHPDLRRTPLPQSSRREGLADDLYRSRLFRFMLTIVFGFPIFFLPVHFRDRRDARPGPPRGLWSHQELAGSDSFTLMAIPFFILAGHIMTEAKITDRIVDFADSWSAGFAEGWATANILSSMIFSGIQGSGGGDASAIGTIMIPPW